MMTLSFQIVVIIISSSSLLAPGRRKYFYLVKYFRWLVSGWWLVISEVVMVVSAATKPHNDCFRKCWRAGVLDPGDSLGLGQTSAGAEVEDIFIRSHWYVMKKAFCLGWCLAVLCKNILFIECLVPWCGQQSGSYVTRLLIQWHNNFSHLILLFQLHWRAQFLSPWHHAIKRHLLYIILYILLVLVFSGGSGGVASWYKSPRQSCC